MATVQMNVRVDEKLRKEAEELCDSLGISLSGAINLFLKTMVRKQGIPFEITLKEDLKREEEQYDGKTI